MKLYQIVGIKLTQAQIDAGGANNLPKGTPVIVVDSNGTQTDVKTSQGGGLPPLEAAGGSSLKLWEANTAVAAGEVRRATLTVGTIGIGDFMSANSARTTGATFDATEAGNWTELANDPDVALKTDLTDGSIQALFDTLRTDSVHFLASATNLDTLATMGWYNVQNPTGGSIAAGWYYIFHGIHINSTTVTPSYAFQLAKRLDSSTTNNLMMRVRTNSTWTAWATIAVSTDIIALSSTTPVMDGTAAIGTGTTSARADHVHASDTSRASSASPTLTGTIALDGTVRIGDGTDLSQQPVAITGAANVYPNLTSTGTSTITTTDTALRICRNGTSGTKWANAMDVNIGSHTAGVNSQTQVDFRLANGGVNTPDTTVLTLKGNGDLLAGTNLILDASDLASTTPAMNGTAAVGTGTTVARADHVHASDTSRAPIDSPVLTGTPQIGGNPKLGSNAAHTQRSFSDITGAAMLMVPATGTNATTIATTDVAARFVKPGTASTKANAVFDIVVGSHTAGLNGATQVDFRLANAGTNAPDTTVMSLKGDGSVSMAGRFSSAFNGARVSRAADGAVATGSTISIAWDTETYDTNSYHDTATNNTRLTAPVAGYYRIGANITWASNSTGFRALGYAVNGGTDVWMSDPLPVSGDITRHNFSTELYLAAGAYIEIRGYQSSGVSLNLGGTTSFATMSFQGN